MSWNNRLLTPGELSADQSLAARVAALIEHQKAVWPALREGYEALQSVEVKRIEIDGSVVQVQHNQRRIRSTAARVDSASVEDRGCFLCADKLPAEEKGIAYGSDIVILCNPLPVFEKHLSIVHRQHVPQRLEAYIGLLLALARDLGPRFVTLYNGPECGASAPDHLHFQAAERELLPIEEALRSVDSPPVERCQICEGSRPTDDFELFTLSDAGRTAVVFRGTYIQRLAEWISLTMAELGRETQKPEPMVNLLCRFDGRQWTVFLFPRARHRPACFYLDGEDQLLVSPGAIDMAGVLVVPVRDHFQRIGPAEVHSIFSEVSVEEEAVNSVVERVCETLGMGEPQ